MSKWSVASVLKFLKFYKVNECLWNPSNQNYKFKTAKEAALKSIVEELNIPELKPSDIKLKIKSIRTAYKRELTNILKSSKENNGRKYVPKLFWFKLADSFLRSISMKKRNNPPKRCQKKIENSESNSALLKVHNTEPCPVETFVNVSNESQENVCNQNEFSNETVNKTNLIIRDPYEIRSNEGQKVQNITEAQIQEIQIEHITDDICNLTRDNSAINSTEVTITDNQGNFTTETTAMQAQSYSIENVENDEEKLPLISKRAEEEDYFIFGRSVAAQLRAIPDLYSRSVAKFRIQQILFEAEIGHYRKGTNYPFPNSMHVNNNYYNN